MEAVAPPTIEERVARLESVEAIKRVKHRYLRACDNKQPEVFRACFTPDAVLDYGEAIGAFTGVDPIVAVFESIACRPVEGRNVVFDMHHAVLPDITLMTPDTAEGSWSLRFRQVNLKRRTETVGAIEYSDSYVRRAGEWLISRSEVRELWSMTTPLSEEVTVRGVLA